MRQHDPIGKFRTILEIAPPEARDSSRRALHLGVACKYPGEAACTSPRSEYNDSFAVRAVISPCCAKSFSTRHLARAPEDPHDFLARGAKLCAIGMRYGAIAWRALRWCARSDR